MTSSKNPDSMTPAEREAENASILAWCVPFVPHGRGQAELGGKIDEPARSLGDGLEFSPEAALRVATRLAGERSGPMRHEIQCQT